MLLAIDIGNTNIVIGLYEPDASAETAGSGLANDWRITTVHDRTPDEHAALFQAFLDQADLDWVDITGVAVSSGVPRVTTSVRGMIDRYLQLDPVVLGAGVKTGMSVLYDNPREVGPDRIANAVGAFDLFAGPTIVVDFGTGTTLDAISVNGEYLGGAIAPGVEISLDALFDRAAGLRAVEMVPPRAAVGKTTAESLQAGTLFGFAGQVDGLARRFEVEMGTCTIVATGGLAPLIAPHSELIEHVEPWLTLHGLRVIYGKNQ
jgi:type III pantothenate kinase